MADPSLRRALDANEFILAPGVFDMISAKVADGTGVVHEQRLYQLIRQRGEVRDRTFRITFLDPGVEAFAFTFG